MRDVTIGGFAFGTAVPLDVVTLPIRSASGGDQGGTSSYQIDTATGEELSAVVHPTGDCNSAVAARRSRQCRSCRATASPPRTTTTITSIYVPAGPYTLQIQDLGGAGTYT